MAYAQILAVTSADADDAATLSVAADIARLQGAVVRLLPAYPQIPVTAWSDASGAAYFAPATWEGLYEAQEAMRAAALKQAEEVAKQARIGFGPDTPAPRLMMAEESPTLWIGLTRELPLTDLVVAGHSVARGEGPWLGVLDEALIGGRSPLLIARGSGSIAARPAVVAWDGSAQAGRAARAAAPLLRQASRTMILQDVARLDAGERPHADPERLADYLRLRGVGEVSIQRLSGDKRESLEEEARSANAALLVAGAYGHSRLQQMLFGGATRSFLASPEGPHLLLAN